MWLARQASSASGVLIRLVSGSFGFAVWSGSSSQVTTQVVMTGGRIYHAIGVYRGAGTATQELWVNGLLIGTANPTASNLNATRAVSFGASLPGNNTSNVIIDFGAVYNRALTVAEIRDRFDRPYAIAAVPRPRSVLGVATSPPPPPPAYSGAVLFPSCM